LDVVDSGWEAEGRRRAGPEMLAERMLLPWDAGGCWALLCPEHAMECKGGPPSHWGPPGYVLPPSLRELCSRTGLRAASLAAPFSHTRRRVYRNARVSCALRLPAL